jgi:hypothetical protein
MPDNPTTEPPEGMNVYFYVGWDAHAGGIAFEHRATSDWRWGWMEREKMIREAVQEEISNG